MRCAGPNYEIKNCKKGTLLCSNCGVGHRAAHKSCPALKAKKQNLFHQKQQKSHADVLIPLSKTSVDEIISLKEQVSERAHLNSEFLALKTELAEVKEQNKRYEKKLSELITYSIFHTRNPKAQEEICFIVRREAEMVFGCPSEQKGTNTTCLATQLCPGTENIGREGCSNLATPRLSFHRDQRHSADQNNA